jgi:ribosomal-protein-alanine N-acetyltransferase
MTFADQVPVLQPFGALQGDKVLLRTFRSDDLSSAYLGWLNDPDVVRYSNQRFRRHDAASCAAYLAAFESSDNLFLAIVGTVETRVIGTMTAYRSRHHGTADVGIMIGDRSLGGRGYGLEAWMLLTDWLLGAGGARKVTCGTLACNSAMRKIAERSGMRLEATRQAQEIVDGELQDILYYARFRCDL